jgi:GntR family transcriptional regulator
VTETGIRAGAGLGHGAGIELADNSDAAGLGPAADEARRRLLSLIARGDLHGGEKLGAERDLAASIGVSRSTLRHALSVLERDGVVRRVPGRGGGTFVTAPKVDRDLSRIVGLPSMLRDQGFLAGTRVISAGVVVADERCARALGLAPGALVLSVVRIRLADGAPISLEHARLPADRFPGLLEQSLGGSLYELLADRYQAEPAEATERIEVHLADAEQAPILGVAVGAPLLSITRTSLDADGRAIEYSHDLFRSDRTSITVRTRGRDTASGSARAHGAVTALGAGQRS